MKENHRQQYLSALNVENYMPRWLLPGAPLPQACLWEIATLEDEAQPAIEDGHSPAEQQPIQNKRVPDTALAEDSLGQLKEAANKKNTKTDAVKAKRSAQDILERQQAAEPSARYSLTLWQISESLIVLDSRQSELALPTDTLLQNILRSVAIPGRLPKADLLRWPLTQSVVVDAGIQQAREHLATLLGAKFSSATAPALWVMGNTAAQYVLSEDQHYESLLGQCIKLENEWFGRVPVSVCVLPSLVDMLQTPQTKKVAWQGLKTWLALTNEEVVNASND